jgi:hypothetical protein
VGGRGSERRWDRVQRAECRVQIDNRTERQVPTGEEGGRRAQSRSFSNLRRCNCEWLAQPQRRDAQHRPTRPTLKGGPAAAATVLVLVAAVARYLSISRMPASCRPICPSIHIQLQQPCGSSSNAPSRLEALPARQVPSAPGCNPAHQYPRASRRVTATRGDRGPGWSLFQPSWPPPALGPFQAQSNGHGI